MTTTVHPTADGDYHLTGYREPAWGTARFDLTLHRAFAPFDWPPLQVLRNADWTAAWVELHKHFKDDRVETMLREALT